MLHSALYWHFKHQIWERKHKWFHLKHSFTAITWEKIGKAGGRRTKGEAASWPSEQAASHFHACVHACPCATVWIIYASSIFRCTVRPLHWSPPFLPHLSFPLFSSPTRTHSCTPACVRHTHPSPCYTHRENVHTHTHTLLGLMQKHLLHQTMFICIKIFHPRPHIFIKPG